MSGQLTMQTRIVVLVMTLAIATGVALTSTTSSGLEQIPGVSALATEDAQAAAPAVVVWGGVRYIVTRAWPWGYRVCARYCVWVPRAWNVYDAIQKARYTWCYLIQRRPNCQL